jgi:DNA polymerase V
MSDRVFSVIKKYATDVEVYSIDESFVDFSNIPDDELTNRLHLIRNEVKRQTGIPVSIGIGPNKTLAKLTSHLAKQNPSYDGVCSYWDIPNIRTLLYNISVDEVWGIGRKWYKKLKELQVETIGQFVMMNDGLVRKLMNVNGLKTKLELLETYCYPITPKPRLKKNIASTRSFGNDVNEFEQIAEAMYSYINSGIKKLKDNEVSPNKVTIFMSGNIHKGEKHSESETIHLQRQTRDINEIWSQVYPHMKSIYSKSRKYKKCGIIFGQLMPENYEQGTLFNSNIIEAPIPETKVKMWEMRQDFKTYHYTTDWDEIPNVFV